MKAVINKDKPVFFFDYEGVVGSVSQDASWVASKFASAVTNASNAHFNKIQASALGAPNAHNVAVTQAVNGADGNTEVVSSDPTKIQVSDFVNGDPGTPASTNIIFLSSTPSDYNNVVVTMTSTDGTIIGYTFKPTVGSNTYSSTTVNGGTPEEYIEGATSVGIRSGAYAEITDPSGAALGLPRTLTQTTDCPNLFLTSSIKFLTVGQYTVLIKYDGSAITQKTVDVGSRPTSDFPLEKAVSVFIDDFKVGGINETATFKLISGTGVLISSGSAAYSVSNSGYSFSTTFDTEGTYYVAWYKEINDVATPFEVHELLIGVSSAEEVLVITAVNSSEIVHTSVRAVLHTVTNADSTKDTLGNRIYTTGVKAGEGTTNVDGDIRFELSPGIYVATLQQNGYVFSPNNFVVTVLDSVTKPPDPLMPWLPKTTQNQHLVSNKFQATLTEAQSPLDTCTLYANLYRMTGAPLRNATVSVALVDKPQLLSGNSVFDTKMAYVTNASGYVEFKLAQGIVVEVAIAPLSLRRTITVPSGDDAVSPVNLLTLMSGADDPFDVIIPNIPAAPRRTL
jgi:hypothetical protein